MRSYEINTTEIPKFIFLFAQAAAKPSAAEPFRRYSFAGDTSLLVSSGAFTGSLPSALYVEQQLGCFTHRIPEHDYSAAAATDWNVGPGGIRLIVSGGQPYG